MLVINEGALQQGHILLADFPSLIDSIESCASQRGGGIDTAARHVGRSSIERDQALPGDHTKKLHGTLRRKEGGHTDPAPNWQVKTQWISTHIRATDSDLCHCGTAGETVKRFLFKCPRWDNLRQNVLSQRKDKRGNLPPSI